MPTTQSHTMVTTHSTITQEATTFACDQASASTISSRRGSIYSKCMLSAWLLRHLVQTSQPMKPLNLETSILDSLTTLYTKTIGTFSLIFQKRSTRLDSLGSQASENLFSTSRLWTQSCLVQREQTTSTLSRSRQQKVVAARVWRWLMSNW